MILLTETLKTTSANESLSQFLYTIMGVIVALIIDSFSKNLLPVITKKRVNLEHICYCLMAPIVLWQFVFQLSKMIDAFNLGQNFYTGLLFVIDLFIIAFICKILYPDVHYSKELKEYNDHWIDNKKWFFLALSIYLFLTTYIYSRSSNYVLGDFDYLRLLMGAISLYSSSVVTWNLRTDYFNKNVQLRDYFHDKLECLKVNGYKVGKDESQLEEIEREIRRGSPDLFEYIILFIFFMLFVSYIYLKHGL